MSALDTAFVVVSAVLFGIFVLYNLATLSLIGLSLAEEVQRKVERGALFRPMRRPLRPGISLVVPAYDERQVIVPAARSLLAADYDPLEVVIVDDGSTDGTLQTLRDAFDLIPLPVGDRFDV